MQNRMMHVKLNLVCEVLFNLIITVMPFVLRTLIIRYLGGEYVGLNSLYVSIMNILSVANLGIDNSLVFHLYKPMAYKRWDEINGLIEFYRKIYFGIATFAFALGILVMPILGKLVGDDAPVGVNIYFCFVCYVFCTLIEYLTVSYKRVLLLSDQHLDYVNITTGAALAIMYSLQIYAIICYNYYLYILLLCISPIASGIFMGFVTKKKYGRYRGIVKKNQIEKKILTNDVIGLITFRLRDIARDACDSIILSFYLGLVVLAQYQNYLMVLVVPILFRKAISNAIYPSFGNYFATKDKEDVYNLYKIILIFQIIISCWFATFFCQFIQEFIAIWIGKEYELPYVVVYMLVLCYFVTGISDSFRMLRDTIGEWSKGKWPIVVEMVANLTLNIILVKVYGVIGIIAATVISISLICIPGELYSLIYKGFKHSILDFVSYILKGLITVILINEVIHRFDLYFLRFGSISFVLKFFMCMLFPPIVLYCVFSRNSEFDVILDVIKECINSGVLYIKRFGRH